MPKKRAASWPDFHPKVVWILMDTGNSNQRSKNYLWWFETRDLARMFLKEHIKEDKRLEKVRGYGLSTLVGPFQYRRVDPPDPRSLDQDPAVVQLREERSKKRRRKSR